MAAPEIVFMFSGQGSHYFQMGRELFEKNETFRNWMVRLDEIPRQIAKNSVVEALYSDARRKGDLFDRTLLTHPAIFMVEFALAKTLIHSGVEPDMVMGASLGSFAAAALAGYLGYEDALRAVVQQAIVFEEYCEPGGMTAILADPVLYAETFFKQRSELAGINFASHFVVSARRSALAEIEAALDQRNIGYQRLPVSFPFHSQWIDQAQAPFEAFMRSIPRKSGQLPLVCCDYSEVLSDLTDDYFWTVARRPVRFRETAARLEQDGPRRYIDVGPAGTLATFLKYGMSPASRSTVHTILTPFGLDQKNLTALVASVSN